MKQHKRVLDRMTMAADLPSETLPKVPLVELAGQRRVLIENHQGVTEYGCKEICVKVKFGHLCICGNDLELNKMTKEQLVITGQIDSITLRRGRC